MSGNVSVYINEGMFVWLQMSAFFNVHEFVFSSKGMRKYLSKCMNNYASKEVNNIVCIFMSWSVGEHMYDLLFC